jgi:O-antigen/teichoic acid export membrane protein
MRRLFVRRSATAAGIYLSVVFGFLATVAGSRQMSVREWGEYSTVVFAGAFLASFFDLTVEEALIKYGFRYVAREDWGRLRQLYRSALRFKLTGASLGVVALLVFAAVTSGRFSQALLVAAPLPYGQTLEGLGGTALFLRNRTDLRSAMLAWAMLLRLVGVGVGAHFGVIEAVAGLVAAQYLATATTATFGWIALHRFPLGEARPLTEDRPDIRSFILRSSASTGVTSLQSGLVPLLLAAVASKTQVGLFRIAQAPQSALLALSAPVRMLLLTEQTRDWEHGKRSAVLSTVRRYSLVAALIVVVAVPPLFWFMPDLVSLVYGERFTPAADTARIFLLVAAIQFVVGWTKSFPVATGRPGLRLLTHGVETAVTLPLVLILGSIWGSEGAAGALLAGMCVFAAMWVVIFRRTDAEDVGPPPTVREAEALESAEAEAVMR